MEGLEIVIQGLWGAGWVAGVVEGSSVMRYAKKDADGGGFPLLASPFYATLAMPLSLMSAAPGPRLASCVPLSPSLVSLQAIAADVPIGSKDGSASVEHDAEPTSTTPTSSFHQGTGIKTRQEWIQQSREENRRHLAQQGRGRTATTSVVSPLKARAATGGIPRWVATLDGRPLPTPLAEAMKRLRVGFVGAGLVLALCSYAQLGDVESLARGILLSWSKEHASDGRTKQAPDSKRPTTSILYRDKPVIYRASEGSDTSSILSDEDYHIVPLSSNKYPSNLPSDIKKVKQLVLEVDLLSKSTISGNETALVLSEALSHASGGREVTQVLLGSDLDAKQKQQNSPDDESSNLVLINAEDALGMAVASRLEAAWERMNGKASADVSQTSAQDGNTSGGEALKSVNGMNESGEDGKAMDGSKEIKRASIVITFIDGIGTGVRESLLAPFAIGRYIWKAVAPTPTKALHVLANDRATSVWLRNSLHSRWRILWYDATKREDVTQYMNMMNARKKTACLSFVHCTNSDDATTAFLLSAIKNSNTECGNEFVALFRSADAADLSRTLLSGHNTRNATILSRQEIHSNLFATARRLLLGEGKSPKEVEQAVAALMGQ